jgi:hypothetical protein
MRDRLKWITQALAQPAEVQISLFPSFVPAPEELAMNWEEAMNGNRDFLEKISEKQRSTFLELDRYMESISGERFLHLWLDSEALFKALEWALMRDMAAKILESMGWQNLPPNADDNDDIYVGSP